MLRAARRGLHGRSARPAAAHPTRPPKSQSDFRKNSELVDSSSKPPPSVEGFGTHPTQEFDVHRDSPVGRVVSCLTSVEGRVDQSTSEAHGCMSGRWVSRHPWAQSSVVIPEAFRSNSLGFFRWNRTRSLQVWLYVLCLDAGLSAPAKAAPNTPKAIPLKPSNSHLALGFITAFTLQKRTGSYHSIRLNDRRLGVSGGTRPGLGPHRTRSTGRAGFGVVDGEFGGVRSL